MYLINNGESLLFINSPYITTAIELKKTNIYISDMPKSDTTRDLIMLNQTRLYQNNAKYVLHLASYTYIPKERGRDRILSILSFWIEKNGDPLFGGGSLTPD